jgi:HlyD family secretion protein
LQGALESAKRNLIQVQRNNEAALAQQKVWLKMAEMGKVWHEARLARYREQLGKCKIYAPQSGMVAYYVEPNHHGHSSTIEEGMAVRYHQPILSIPDLSCMQVQTAVHESVIDTVKAGMPASVRLDAFHGRHYDATVKSVDVLPDPGGWLSSDIKVYKTIVTIDQEVENVKPGMTAVVEIDIARLHDVICIPIQAILQRGGETWCYAARNRRVAKCPIKTGRTNDKLVEIVSGLSPGDRVVVNPSTILADDPGQEREKSNQVLLN